MNKSDLILNNQEEKNIKYQDLQLKNRHKKITLRDSGHRDGLVLSDLINNGDKESNYIKAAQLIMQKVIISPNISFESQNADLKNNHPDLLEKDMTKNNKDGKEITIKMKFPSYEDALDILFNTVDSAGGMHLANTYDKICDKVLRTDKNEAISTDYFDNGHPGAGLFQSALKNSVNYLISVTNHDGFRSMLVEGIRFLTTSIES